MYPSSAPGSDANTTLAGLDATIQRAAGSPLYAERVRGVRVQSLDDLRKIALTTRVDLQRAGLHGTRAVPLERVCHYGETSGTTGAGNSTWLTSEDFTRNAEAIMRRHPDVFAAGRILLNRFPFMAAPAHLMQLIARLGGGVAIPAGNINWDVPFPRALELARTTGAQTLAGMPLEPIVLAEIARASGTDPATATNLDAFFLGGSALPPALSRRIARVWDARVVELYGSTETMLLGTSCAEATLHVETDCAFAEVLKLGSDEEAEGDEVGRLVVTTLGVEGSPLIRFDTGDLVRRLPPCRCGDPRPGIVVLGRDAEVVEIAGQRLYTYDIIDAATAAADAIDSSVFFVVILPDRFVLRIESEGRAGDPEASFRKRLGDAPVEVELVRTGELLDVELLSRSPQVYKPVVVSDWRRPGRRIATFGEGMIEWPRLSPAEVGRWLGRTVRGRIRKRSLARSARVAGDPGR